MNILLCHTTLRSGGVESLVLNLANELSKTNTVTLCLIFKPQDDDVCLKKLSKDIKVISLGKSRPGVEFSLWFKLIKVFLKEKYDAIQLNGFFFYYFIAIVFLHRFRKFFYTVHNDAKEENRSWDNKIIGLKSFCFRRKWMIPITISHASQESFQALYGCESHLIYNGVPSVDTAIVSKVAIDKGDCTCVLYNPARISSQKNQIMLCQVVSELQQSGYNILLIIAGSPDSTEIYQELKTFLSKKIIYLGEVDNSIEYMYSADAMCLSSLYEGMPIALLESLSVGCVPICTPVGGIINVIKNKYNGILSDDTSKEAYKKAIIEFYNLTMDQKKNMVNNCKMSFEEYSIEKTAREYLLIFNHYKE